MKLLLDITMQAEVYEDMKAKHKTGELWSRWLETHPRLFDKEDERLLKDEAKSGFHFHECLAAVMIFDVMGWLSLIEKYQWGNHPQKHEVIRRIDSPILYKAIQCINDEFNGRYGPDLLVYAPNYSDWFFCEAKGPRDVLNDRQRVDFRRLPR